MPLNAFFSRHALKRVRQRLTLDLTDLTTILDNNLFVDIGTEPGFNRRHLLFYSAPDQEHFVAVQDVLTGTVVTILPLEYHRNLAWDITAPQMASAKARCYSEPPLEEPAKPTSNASVFSVSAHYHDEHNNLKTTTLLKFPAASYGNRMDRLIRDPGFIHEVEEAAKKKHISISIRSISIRLGNKGQPVFIDLQE